MLRNLWTDDMQILRLLNSVQSYQENARVEMKGYVQCNLVYESKISASCGARTWDG